MTWLWTLSPWCMGIGNGAIPDLMYMLIFFGIALCAVGYSNMMGQIYTSIARTAVQEWTVILMTKAEIIDYLYDIHAHADYSIEDIADDLAVSVRQGHWVYTPTSPFGFTCSECGIEMCRFNFCPNCGADMRKDGDYAEGTIQKERS